MRNHLNFWHNYKSHNSFYVILIVAAVIILLGVSLGWFFVYTIDKTLFNNKIEPYVEHVQQQARTHIFDSNRPENRSDEDSIARFKEFLEDIDMGDELKYVNIFTKERRLIASTDSGRVGQIDGDNDLTEALLGKVVYKKAEAPDEKPDLNVENLSELYVPVPIGAPGGEVPGAVEIYFDNTRLVVVTSTLKIWMSVFVLASIVIIAFVLYFSFKSQNAQIIQRNREISGIIEKSPIGIYTIDKEGVIESFNPKMVELSGCKTAEEIIGMNTLELPTYKESGLDNFFREGLKGKPFETEARYVSHTYKKETYRHYHGVPIFGPDGKTIERLLLLVEDVTERVRLESQLEEHAKDLEVKVAERTQELQSKMGEMSRLNRAMVGREIKMIELKKEIERLKKNKES